MPILLNYWKCTLYLHLCKKKVVSWTAVKFFADKALQDRNCAPANFDCNFYLIESLILHKQWNYLRYKKYQIAYKKPRYLMSSTYYLWKLSSGINETFALNSCLQMETYSSSSIFKYCTYLLSNRDSFKVKYVLQEMGMKVTNVS